MNTRTTVFPTWNVTGPIWVAPGYLSQSIPALKRWESSRPSAITLKTTGDLVRAAAPRNIGRLKVRLVADRTWGASDLEGSSSSTLYCNGEPRYEFLPLDDTEKLLAFAKAKLPDSAIGISIMMGEEYAIAAKVTKRYADFAELNMKFAARMNDSLSSASLSISAASLERVLDHVARFVEEYAGVPVFIKLTREFPWLMVCREFSAFVRRVNSLRQQHRIGIILANTRQTRVPLDLVPVSMRARCDKTPSGIIAGRYLYIETYDIVRRLCDHYPELADIPVVATGGALTLSSIVEFLRAGATAVQMYTAFDIYGTDYYRVLAAGLERLMADAGFSSFDQLLATLRTGDQCSIEQIRRLAVNQGGVPSLTTGRAKRPR